jgi:uncharacterized OsmC-like protein
MSHAQVTAIRYSMPQQTQFEEPIMRDMARYKECFERNKKAIELRPTIGRETMSTTCRVAADTLAGEISGDGFTFRTDAHEEEGGEGITPSAGVLVRGGMAACCAIDIVIYAAIRAIPIGAVEVEVQADCDGHGMYGLADVTPGYTALRYIVTVESSAPEAEIMAMLDEADRHAHLLSVARDAVPVTRKVRITAPAEA